MATLEGSEPAIPRPLQQVACLRQEVARVRRGGVSLLDGRWALGGFFLWELGWECGFGSGVAPIVVNEGSVLVECLHLVDHLKFIVL